MFSYVRIGVKAMRYHNITKDDMLNGDGLRVVLWVAGCGHHCKGCHGLTGTGFANDSDDFSFSHLKIDMIHNCVYATLCWKTNGQILDF